MCLSENLSVGKFDCRKMLLSENVVVRKFAVGKYVSENLPSEKLFWKICHRKICCQKNLRIPFSLYIHMQYAFHNEGTKSRQLLG